MTIAKSIPITQHCVTVLFIDGWIAAAVLVPIAVIVGVVLLVLWLRRKWEGGEKG